MPQTDLMLFNLHSVLMALRQIQHDVSGFQLFLQILALHKLQDPNSRSGIPNTNQTPYLPASIAISLFAIKSRQSSVSSCAVLGICRAAVFALGLGLAFAPGRLQGFSIARKRSCKTSHSYIGQVTTLHLSSLRIQQSSGKVQGITRRTWSQHTRRAWDRGIWQVGAIQDAVHKTLGWGHTQARSGSLCHGLFLIKAGFLPAPVGDRLHTVRSVLVLVASTAYDRFDFCPGLAGLAGGRQTHKEASNLMTQTSYIWLGGLENPRVTISATVSSSHPLLSWVDRCLSNSRLASVVSRDLLVANHFFSSSCFS